MNIRVPLFILSLVGVTTHPAQTITERYFDEEHDLLFLDFNSRSKPNQIYDISTAEFIELPEGVTRFADVALPYQGSGMLLFGDRLFRNGVFTWNGQGLFESGNIVHTLDSSLNTEHEFVLNATLDRAITLINGDIHSAVTDFGVSGGIGELQRVTDLGVFTELKVLAWESDQVYLHGNFDRNKPIVKLDIESGDIEETKELPEQYRSRNKSSSRVKIQGRANPQFELDFQITHYRIRDRHTGQDYFFDNMVRPTFKGAVRRNTWIENSSVLHAVWVQQDTLLLFYENGVPIKVDLNTMSASPADGSGVQQVRLRELSPDASMARVVIDYENVFPEYGTVLLAPQDLATLKSQVEAEFALYREKYGSHAAVEQLSDRERLLETFVTLEAAATIGRAVESVWNLVDGTDISSENFIKALQTRRSIWRHSGEVLFSRTDGGILNIGTYRFTPTSGSMTRITRGTDALVDLGAVGFIVGNELFREGDKQPIQLPEATYHLIEIVDLSQIDAGSDSEPLKVTPTSPESRGPISHGLQRMRAAGAAPEMVKEYLRVTSRFSRAQMIFTDPFTYVDGLVDLLLTSNSLRDFQTSFGSSRVAGKLFVDSVTNESLAAFARTKTTILSDTKNFRSPVDRERYVAAVVKVLTEKLFISIQNRGGLNMMDINRATSEALKAAEPIMQDLLSTS